jgi:hypothetical protein
MRWVELAFSVFALVSLQIAIRLGMWEEAGNPDVDEREAWRYLLADVVRQISHCCFPPATPQIGAPPRMLQDMLDASGASDVRAVQSE